MFEVRKSIHGREMAISSSGGWVTSVTSTGSKNSTDFDMAAQMWGLGMITNVTSGTTLANCGVNLLTSSTLASMSFDILAPVAGVSVEIISRASATAITFETASASVVFGTSQGAADSTALALSAAAGLQNTSIILRGTGSTRYQVMSNDLI